MDDIVADVLADIRSGAPYQPREERIGKLANAYAIQTRVTAALMADHAGRRIAGYKIAFNRAQALAHYGISEPCYAPLFSDQILPSGTILPPSSFVDLVIEPEIAVRLKSPVPHGASAEEVAASIGAYIPAIELMDARGAFKLDPSAASAVAHRVHSKGAVIGPETALPNLDVAPITTRLTIGGSLIGEVTGGAPQTPVEALRWLAGRLAADGLPLEPGMLVLTGTHLPARPTGERGEIKVSMSTLGDVSVKLL